MLNPLINKVSNHFLRYPKRYSWTVALLLCYSILGFFIVPWLIEKKATQFFIKEYDTELSIEKVQLNPFTLSAKLIQLQIIDPDKKDLLNIDEISINFQLSSIFNQALTFKELTINSPEIFIARNNANIFNFSYFIKPSENTASETDDSGIFPVIIHQASLQHAILKFDDEVPSSPVSTRLDPINITITNFSTLENERSHHTISINSENDGTLNIEGEFSLNPISASGNIVLDIAEFPLIFSYLKEDIGIDVIQGRTELELNYMTSFSPEEALSLELKDINLGLTGLNAELLSSDSTPSYLSKELLSSLTLEVTNGTFLWPQKSISIAEVSLLDTHLNLQRDNAGILTVVDLPILTRETTSNPQASNEASPQWDIDLGQLLVNHLSIDVQDFTVEPEARIAISDLNLSLAGFNNREGSRFPLSMDSELSSGGTINIDGQFTINPNFNLTLETRLDDLDLSLGTAYLYSLTSLDLESGLVDFSGQLSSTVDDILDLNGSLNISNLSIIDPSQGSSLFAWNELDIDNMALSLNNPSLEFSEILIDGLYGDVVINQEGRVNLGGISESSSESDPVIPVESEPSPTSNMEIVIGKITIQNSGADFADYSLPLPFSAKIAELNGDISTISSTSNEPVATSLEGTVDEFGLVRINGSLTPLNLNSNTDLSVSFQNVDIPKFSAYMIPFAGREIDSGRLDLDLIYKVTNNQLDSESSILLRDFSLGDKIDHEDATSLPLDLAVALLKNPEGNIDLNLPVSGDTNDPQFSFGSIIRQVFSNLIIKAVASPFTFLANLVGIEGNELENINFLPGQSSLAPPEIEKSFKLAEALALRPELVLQIVGVVDYEVDGLALKTKNFETMLDKEITSFNASNSDVDMYAEQQKLVLEKLFNEYKQINRLTNDLEEIKAEFTTVEIDEESLAELSSQFDELAYVNKLKNILLGGQIISEEELNALADLRASNTKAAIISQNNNLENQLSLLESSAISANDELIQMKVSLTQKSSPR